MTYHCATRCLGPNLAAFSLHAKRKILTADGAKDPGGLLQLLERFCDWADYSGGKGKAAASGKKEIKKKVQHQ